MEKLTALILAVLAGLGITADTLDIPNFGAPPAPTGNVVRGLTPETDSTYNIGQDDVRWLYGWFDNLVSANSSTTNSTTTGEMYIGGNLDVIGNASTTGDLFVGGNATVTSTLEAGDIYIPSLQLTGSTNRTLNDNFKLLNSAGNVSGGVISDAGSETIDVSAGTGVIRIADDDSSQLKHFDYSASTTIDVSGANRVSFVGVEYNGGSPRIALKTTDDWDIDTEYPLGNVSDIGGTLHISNAAWYTADFPGNILELTQAFSGFMIRDNYIGGLILSVTGTRNVAVTAGTLRARTDEFEITALDTSSSGSFITMYQDGTGDWTVTTGVTQYPVTSYDDGDGTLGAVASNKYANFWVYAEADGEIVFLYPQQIYNTASQATDGALPSTIPNSLLYHGTLIGRITFQGSVDEPVQVSSAFTDVFAGSQATDHGNLAGLSDDDHTQYGLLAGRTGGDSWLGLNIFSDLRATVLNASTTANFNDLFTYGNATTTGHFEADSTLYVRDSRVGVGTTTPQGALAVVTTDTPNGFTPNTGGDDFTISHNTSGGMSIFTPDANKSNIFFGSPSRALGSAFSWKYDDLLLDIGTFTPSADIAFNSGNNVEAMRLTAAGYLGIGTTTPDHMLSITQSSSGEAAQFNLYNPSNGATASQAIKFTYGTGVTNGGKIIQGYNSGNYMAFQTGGTETMRLLQNGDIGIGQTLPTAALHIDSSAGSSDGLVFLEEAGSAALILDLEQDGFLSTLATNAGGIRADTANRHHIDIPAQGYFNINTRNIATGDRDLQFRTGSAGTERMRINGTVDGSTEGDVLIDTDTLYVDASANRVGLGMSDPAGTLEVLQQGSVAGIIVTGVGTGSAEVTLDRNSQSSWEAAINFQDAGDQEWQIGMDNANTDDFYIIGDVGTVMTIADSDGAIGIGTTDPDGDLELRSSSGSTNFYMTDATDAVKTLLQTSGGSGFLLTTSAHDFRLGANNTEVIRIDTAGQVGIGTTAPTSTLQVEGGDFHAMVDGGRVGLFVDESNATRWVGIGTTTPGITSAGTGYSGPGLEIAGVGNAKLNVTAASPAIFLTETDQAADNQIVGLIMAGGELQGSVWTDTLSADTGFFGLDTANGNMILGDEDVGTLVGVDPQLTLKGTVPTIYFDDTTASEANFFMGADADNWGISTGATKGAATNLIGVDTVGNFSRGGHFSAYDGTGNLTLNAGYKNIGIDTTFFIDTGTYTFAAPTTTVDIAGTYRISADCGTVNTVGSARTSSICRIEVNNTAVTGTECNMYNRVAGVNGTGGCSITYITALSANDAITVAATETGTDTITTDQNASRLTIEFIQ